MANNSYRRYAFDGYGNGFARAPYSQQYQQARQPKKHSGAKAGQGKNGVPYVYGWNASRKNGMVTFLATPYKGTAVHTSKTGRNWENWMVKVQPKMGKSFIVSGLYDQQTRKVTVSELGIVINPSAPNRGYCGRFGSK